MTETYKKSTNILIAEDSFFFSKWLYAEFLKIEGINIVGFVDNIGEAYKEIENQEIDIAILDIRLKEGSATNFIEQIKSSYNNIIVIVFSNNVEFKEACLKLGADYFFDKSNEFDDLLELVSNLSINNLHL
jgi:two-component system OmpR family response regulator